MDPLTAVGLASAGLSYISVTSKVAYAAFSYISGKQYSTLRQNYGSSTALFINVFLPNSATQFERVEKVILKGNDDDALAFRQAMTDECNMTAVAGAIIAQVAITGLSLPSLSSTHWVARAFLLFAVTSGCLSVYFCCVLQRTVSKLYRPQLIRTWLSLPVEERQDEMMNKADKRARDEGSSTKASLAAVFIISAPFTMMKASIFAFLMGLIIYQGFMWTRALDTSAGRGDSRDVFITFVVGTGICVLFYLLTFSSKFVEYLIGVGRRQMNSINPAQMSELPAWSDTAPRIPMHPRQNVDDFLFVGGLPAALEAAAQAHIQSAEADRRVAFEYSQISRLSSSAQQGYHISQAHA